MSEILLIYTGGTIGMVKDPDTGALKPFDFARIEEHVPEIRKFGYRIESDSFKPVLDSSNMDPSRWVELAGIIKRNYDKYDGFVILHGTDTMAYTSSALSFLFEGLNKPVILTGSQLPIGEIRTDAKENLVTAIEIAATKENNEPLIKEVCIFFDFQLFRGNRASKFSSSKFEAFHSPNFPSLAEAGVRIRYKKDILGKGNAEGLKVASDLVSDVALIKIFPGMMPQSLSCVLDLPGLKGVVLETFGSGNAPTGEWFLKPLENAIKKGISILNVSQCKAGGVEQGRYETSLKLEKIGVVGGKDLTTEAAVTKMMYLLGKGLNGPELKDQLTRSLRGELS